MLTFSRLAQIEKRKQPFALCSVVETSGSTPRKVGAKMLVLDDGSEVGQIEGSIGGGALEHEIRKKAVLTLSTGESQLITLALTHDLAMCCGGKVSVFIEASPKKPTAILLGAGHINQKLAKLTANLGFETIVADDRTELLKSLQEQNIATFNGTTHSDLDEMPFSKTAYIVIATHCHKLDQKMVEASLNRPYKYLALVGSKRKRLMTNERLKAKNYKQYQIDSLHCPAGIDIYAETAEEIALSIASQMVSVRRTG